jgi:uracil-DNA glycosylase family 4
MTTLVPNRFPLYPSNLRIAIVGEAPGNDEVREGRPFIGSSGRFLAALLSRAGISIDACYLGNVSQYQPPGNDINLFSWTNDEIQNGLYQLELDMKVFKPNIVVLLGNTALKAAKDSQGPITKKGGFSVAKWRGSLFLGLTGPFDGLKCIPTYHPAYCLRDYESTPMLQFDLRKAVREATSPLLLLPVRTFATTPSVDEQCRLLRELRTNARPVALDIEGGIDCMSCVSFADSPGNAFIIPIYNKSGKCVSTPEVWRELALTLEDENVPKILQNSLYDRFVLHYSYGIRVRGVVHDTMLKHWELYSELEKSLGVQASIYTDEPYYKGDRKSVDDRTFFEYCCRDSAVTLEISQKLTNMLSGSSLQHYNLNMGLLNPVLYMELRGIRYDVGGAQQRRGGLLVALHTAQARLNSLTGHGFSWKSITEIQTYAQQKFYTIKGDRVRKKYLEDSAKFSELLTRPNPGLATIGEIEDLCGVSLNVGSKIQFQKYLYETLKLPTQMSQIRGEEPHPTTDYEALLNLSRWCTQNKHDFGFRVCQAAIEIRALQTRQGMLAISADRDGRIRCGYNLVGSNTGRITCYESPTGSGYNLQTIPNYTVQKEAPGGVLGDRDLFLADQGYHLFQCDLAGADGWTVAAYCAMLGDESMLEHYKARLKPYWAIALKLLGTPVNFKDLDSLCAACAYMKLEDWMKLTAKRVQHGGAYLEGGLTISRNILKDSEGKFYITPQECDKLKNWYIREMYPGIPKWHDWIARRLKERPVLTAASGQVRQFFGRPDEILTKAVAFEPQANTTYATNLAAWRLWSDPDNRVDRDGVNHLRIEPLHQVHDALIGQFKQEDTTWATAKIKSYFQNPLTIAGQQITIPFDGGYGPSWGNLPNKL